jgi:hypothetical protein
MVIVVVMMIVTEEDDLSNNQLLLDQEAMCLSTRVVRTGTEININSTPLSWFVAHVLFSNNTTGCCFQVRVV